MFNAEIIRISQSEYNQLVKKAKDVQEHTDETNETKTVMKFTDRNNFPTVEEIERHNVIHNLRKYLPFLVYYHTQKIFTTNEKELKRSKEYIAKIIKELVDIVDDDDVAEINSITPGVWKKASHEQKCNILAPLISYYGWNEFENFVKDLEWKKFMMAYGYTQKKAKDGLESPELREELASIWDTLQN